MLYSKLQRGREAHGLNARITRGEQFEIGDITCGSHATTDIESCLLQFHPSPLTSPPTLPPDQKGATQIAKHCFHSCFPARRALPGRNSELNGFKCRHPYSQLTDHRT